MSERERFNKSAFYATKLFECQIAFVKLTIFCLFSNKTIDKRCQILLGNVF